MIHVSVYVRVHTANTISTQSSICTNKRIGEHICRNLCPSFVTRVNNCADAMMNINGTDTIEVLVCGSASVSAVLSEHRMIFWLCSTVDSSPPGGVIIIMTRSRDHFSSLRAEYRHDSDTKQTFRSPTTSSQPQTELLQTDEYTILTS